MSKPRPAKRHLVRWTDDMDKKLLLTMQAECNRLNILLPWTEIGATMGPLISGGAVIQHLAKLRTRMVAQGLSVPPPLKRGGGAKISTGPSMPRLKAPASASMPTRGAPAKKFGKAAPAKRSKANDFSDEEDEEFNSNSDGEYGVPRTKRTKTSKRRSRKASKDSHDDSDDEKDSEDGTNDEEDGNGDRVVAAGAPFLALEDDVPSKSNELGKTQTKSKSMIVKLDIGKDGRAAIKTEADDSSSEEDDEVEDNGEGNAIHALAVISARPSYLGVPTSRAPQFDSPVEGTFNSNTTNLNASPYVGLPSNVNNPLQHDNDTLDTDTGFDYHTNQAPYTTLLQTNGLDMGYSSQYSPLVNGGMINNSSHLNTFSMFNDNQMVPVHNTGSHTRSNLSRLATSYTNPPQALLPAGGNLPLSAGATTVNQTPDDTNADSTNTQSFHWEDLAGPDNVNQTPDENEAGYTSGELPPWDDFMNGNVDSTNMGEEDFFGRGVDSHHNLGAGIGDFSL